MVIVDQRIAQVVVFQRELDGGDRELRALFHAVPLGEGAGGDVPDDDLQRNDGDLFHQGPPIGQLLHKMGGDALFFQQAHHVVAHAVVDHAFATDSAFFQAVQGGGVILILYDVKLRITGFEDLLGLSFVKLLQFFHVCHSDSLLFVRRFV